ncbi:hypothetical protein PV326_010189 [Microctonus aethiopoides]|nr:hypothetical protein PV326_010189 [Microctonus aethiopoides]
MPRFAVNLARDTTVSLDILLKNIIGETRLGLNSVFSIKCHNCSSLTNVRTGKNHTSKNGALHAGVGCTCLNKILACSNFPTISTKLFKKYEREVEPAIEEAAKESCKRAAEEERGLVIENVEELCKQLSEEISQTIYGADLITLKKAIKEDKSETSQDDDPTRVEIFDINFDSGSSINLESQDDNSSSLNLQLESQNDNSASSMNLESQTYESNSSVALDAIFPSK